MLFQSEERCRFRKPTINCLSSLDQVLNSGTKVIIIQGKASAFVLKFQIVNYFLKTLHRKNKCRIFASRILSKIT